VHVFAVGGKVKLIPQFNIGLNSEGKVGKHMKGRLK